MHLKRLLAFIKPYLRYISIFAVTALLAACEGLPVSNEKPVFTIANIPSFVQEEAAPIDDVQPETQTAETSLSEDKQGEPASEPVEPEPVIKQALSQETIQTNTRLNNAKATEETKIANTSEEEGSLPKNISQENIPKKSSNENQHIAEQNTDLVETILEHQSEAPLLPEPLTSTEIASSITMPPSIYTPPPLERIRIDALLNTNGSALRSIMGVPNFVLRKGEVKLWQYDVGECIIDFFLRQKEHDYIVTFIEIRAKMLGDTINEPSCESALAQALNS